MASASETTNLLEEPHQYVYTSIRKQRARQFQCCLCWILMVGLLTALIIAVAYSINLPINAPDSSTDSSETNDSDSAPLSNNFLVLFDQNLFPLEDQKRAKNSNNQSHVLEEAMTQGQILLKEKDAIETVTPSLEVDSPSFRHQRVLGTSEKARNMSRHGYRVDGASQFYFAKFPNASSQEICFPNNNLTTSDFLIEMCSNGTLKCNTLYKYRSYNGTCNNLNHPNNYGVAYRPFRRAVAPDYGDGVSKPRLSKSGQPLPSSRTVSLEVHRSYFRDDSKFSVMLAVWGQFLDHDITGTALSQKENGSSISCCQSEGIQSPDCFPVFLGKTDLFVKYNVSCLEFVRSAPAPRCCLGSREQMNQVSAFIDGSVVYGSDEDKAKSLRTMSNGTLKLLLTPDNRTLLPVSEDMADGCNREEEREKGRYCFASGDARANENLHLTSMHLLWARQHNLLAKNLSNLNPHWDDERIFQESRRILGAQMQHITFQEFLPVLLGKNLMKRHNLLPTGKHFNKYNSSLDPTIANEFASAAFRFAHTIIPGLVKSIANDTSSPEYIQMHQMLFNPFKLYNKGHLDGALRGAINTSIEASDPYFSDELKSHLFERHEENLIHPNCGLDLVTLNIQRGRDHGLAGYTVWRRHCGFGDTGTFGDLDGMLDEHSLENIRAVYRDVKDIDLYTGALSEKPLKGSILGPTLTCLILDQFKRIKFGDRFWYENPESFTLEQLKEIQKTSLARIICDNSDEIRRVQPLVMEGRTNNGKNDLVPCTEIPVPDLGLWKERRLEHRLDLANQNLNVVVMH